MSFIINAGPALTGGLTTVVIPSLGLRSISSFPYTLEDDYYIFDILESNDITAEIVSSPAVTASIWKLLEQSYITATYNGYPVTQNIFLDLLTDISTHTAGGTLNMDNNLITNLAQPVNPNDAATKEYVDNIAAGLDPKESVRITTTTTITGATYNATGGTGGTGIFTNVDTTSGVIFDGLIDNLSNAITLSVGNRILVKDQVDAKQNGIYVVVTAGVTGSIERSPDADGSPSNEVHGGNFTFVENGATNSGLGYVLVADGVVVLNTDNVVWTTFSASGSNTAGNGILISGLSISINLDTDSGLEFDTAKLQIKTDTVTANTIGVTHTTNGAGIKYASTKGLTETTETLEIKLETNGGIAFDGTNGGLEIKPDITTGATVVPINTVTNGAGILVDNSTVENNSGTLRVKADGINDTHIDFGTGTNQVNALDIPIVDAGGNFVATTIEAALNELYTSASKISWVWYAAQNGNATNIYLSSDQVPSNTTEFIVPVNCTIYAMSADSNGGTTFIAEARNSSGTVLSSLTATSGNGYQKFVSPAAVTAGTQIRIYCNGTSINRPRISIFFKES